MCTDSLALLLLAFAAAGVTCLAAENFAYLMFSQQWSVGYCKGAFQDRCVKQNERNFWTIHGLWPSNDTKTPDFCNHTLRYNATVLKPLLPQLQQYWPSYTTNNSNLFWKHEWQKHGTCATVVPQLDGLFNFFSTTLQIYTQHNITEYLHNNGIDPSLDKTYSVAEIEEALTDDLKGAANLVCYRNKNYTAPVLAEIRICMDKDLRPINCSARHSGCGRSGVYYLPFGTDDGNAAASTRFAWHLEAFVVLVAFARELRSRYVS